jgi:beta-glucosidase
LQRKILKGQWGYDGMIVSDWGSIGEMKVHGYAANEKEAGLKAILAGSDMDMESYVYEKYLKTLVEEGKVDVELIDDAARRILNLKHKLGLFEDPYKYCDVEREARVIGSNEIILATRNMARKSVVLLKNKNRGLPIKANKSVAVIGPLVSDKNSPLGSWRIAGKDNSAISVEEGLSKYKAVNWTFLQGVQLTTEPTHFVLETKINENNRTGILEAVAKAKEVDQVIMVLGEHGYQSGEARSRTKLNFPGLQQELLEAVYAVNPNIVLIVMSGRPLDLSWADEHIPTIVQAWQLGTESGNALAEIIMGEYNPSGKLPMSFPRSVGQMPLYYNCKSTGRPTQEENPDVVFWSHYIDEENSALYPFGHGESYTTFTYNNLKVSNTSSGFIVNIRLTNTGNMAGEEITQLYIRDISASITRPIKELKGFEKNMLQPDESKIITFTLTDKELGFYDNEGNYHVEDGMFDIMVGGSSEKILKATAERITVDMTP